MDRKCCFCGAEAESKKRTTITLQGIAELIVGLRNSKIQQGTNHFAITEVSVEGGNSTW